MDAIQDIFPHEALLSDEIAEQRKQERRYRIHARVEPIIRLLAIALVTLMAVVYAAMGHTHFSALSILEFSLIVFVIHGGVTWMLLIRFVKSYPSVYDLVSILDFVFMTVGIYFTGGESSFLYFVYITRVADQISSNDKRRVLYFSALGPLCYLSMLLYIVSIDKRTIDFEAEGIKMLTLFGCSAYLMVVGRSVAKIRERMAGFWRSARKAYQMLEEDRRELERLNDQKNEFLGIAAHDLRTPLNGIQGYASLMMHDLETNQLSQEEAKDNLNDILTITKRMSKLVTDLLDVSAIESGNVHLNKMKIPLANLLKDCEKLNARAAAQKNIAFGVDVGPNLPEIWMDKHHMINVMDNLLSNAIKYTHAGGSVRVHTETTDKEVIVHVHDTGQGLSHDDMRYIFTSFKRLSAKPTGGESSTGLGLAIAKKIVELHDGRIWVDSEKGKGSTFSFSLPLEGKDV